MKNNNFPFIKDIEKFIEPDLMNKFPYSFLQKNCIIPVRGEDGNIIIVGDDPLKIAIGEIKSIWNKDVKIAKSDSEKILECLEKYYYHPSSSEKIVNDLKEEEIAELQKEIDKETTNLLDLANKAPVIRLVNQIIYRALSMRASDIHLQTLENSFNIRFRIDGVLHDIFQLPKRYQPAIISRIKIISGLNIAEKRIPQDGRTTIKVDGRKIDIRVSIVPTFFGESAVLRLLDQSSFLLEMENLGLLENTYELFNKLIHYDHGIILITGPTGSGKTTTLYSALSRINKREVNIITLEDPVEYNIEGINQIQINPKAGLTFANGLRSILRHDPDIIMVGEIRDLETAEMAIQASLTGHLVFSTLHTNDSASAITRLLDMGIEPYLIASSLIGVMAQRLVRLNCPECSEPVEIPPSVIQEIIPSGKIEDANFMEGKGCEKCLYTGYYGRTGIFELLVIDENIRKLIMERASSNVIKNYAIEKKGLKTLRMDGIEKAKRGLTTISEVLRVTQEI
ncbi:MAG TPA: type II secretion system protein GspE [bacterium]|nr:type II secretion system protein GspE [bacterium]